MYDRFPGAASDAVAVLIEGSESGLELARLPQQLLLEAIHLAIGLRAWQWATQISDLPRQVFSGELGPQLHRVVTEFELEVMQSSPRNSPSEPCGGLRLNPRLDGRRAACVAGRLPRGGRRAGV